MLLWFEAMMIALSFDTLIGFSLFHGLLFGCGHILFFYPDFIYGGSMEPAFGI